MPKLNYPKLPPVFKEKFLKALRSGRYKPTQYSLYDPKANEGEGGYCILGVAGIAAGIGKNRMKRKIDLEDFDRAPKVLRDSRGDSIANLLMGKHDGKEWSFKQAARWIEKHL